MISMASLYYFVSHPGCNSLALYLSGVLYISIILVFKKPENKTNKKHKITAVSSYTTVLKFICALSVRIVNNYSLKWRLDPSNTMFLSFFFRRFRIRENRVTGEILMMFLKTRAKTENSTSKASQNQKHYKT